MYSVFFKVGKLIVYSINMQNKKHSIATEYQLNRIAFLLYSRKFKFSKSCVAQKYRVDLYSKNRHSSLLRHSDIKSVASRIMIFYSIIIYSDKFINFNVIKFPTLKILFYSKTWIPLWLKMCIIN